MRKIERFGSDAVQRTRSQPRIESTLMQCHVGVAIVYRGQYTSTKLDHSLEAWRGGGGQTAAKKENR